jgi:hypothetical protein
VNVRVTLRARGGADPALVWERYARLELWPTWSPQVRRVEPDDARLSAGLEGLVHGPAGLAARFAVTAADEDAWTWSWQVRPGLSSLVTVPITLTLDHVVRARPGGSETSLTIAGSPLAAPLVAGYAPVARLALQRLLRP